MARTRESGELPTKEAVLQFIKQQRSPVGRREIAREFRLDSADRQHLVDLLDAMEDEKIIHRARNRRYSTGAEIPSVGVLEVTGLDKDGEPVMSIVGQDEAAPAIKIHLARGHQRGRAPGIGDRVLARLDRKSDNYYVAHVMRRLETPSSRVFGIFRTDSRGGQIQPASKRLKSNFHVAAGNTGGAEDGEFVAADVVRGRLFGMPIAKITERIGAANEPAAITRLAIASNDIPEEFSPEAIAEADAALEAPLAARADLRDVPLVTIDDETARDFDDAVWAEPDSTPGNEGGWHLIVAIADVAWYVRPNSALDHSAHQRGNSVYLPDKVIPMLPGALSNGWCSLKPDEDRPCVTVDVWIDASGNKLRHNFRRALMRSAARLTYNRVQAVQDGEQIDGALPPDGLLDALYGAFASLFKQRIARGTIDLDLPERRVVLNRDGTIKAVETRIRHDSHRLIEEFMILANVCAAETLEEKGQPCMYRIHDDPAPDRVVALRQYLETLGLSLRGGQAVRPRNFAQLIGMMKDRKDDDGIQTAILRCQAQAVYGPDNFGHFGLALRNYAHFTSPIRRYSDLLVHRALIRGLGLGDGALEEGAGDKFPEIGTHISMTERRAMAAERDAFDRLSTLYLADRVGARFDARVTGVERFGLFVELMETGANGLLPVSLLGDERFEYDARLAALVGQATQQKYALGDRIEVKLSEADPATGKLAFTLADGNAGGRRQPAANHRPRNSGAGHRRGGGPSRKRRN